MDLFDLLNAAPQETPAAPLATVVDAGPIVLELVPADAVEGERAPVSVADPPVEVVVEEEPQSFFEGFYTKEDLAAMKIDEVFPKVTSKLATDYRCPCCGYEWSGSPKPKQEEADAETAV